MLNLPARQTYNKILWHSFIGISFICFVGMSSICRQILREHSFLSINMKNFVFYRRK